MTLLFHMFPVASGSRSRPAQLGGVVVFIAGTLLACTPTPRDFNATGGGNIAGSGGMAGMGGAGGSGGVEPIPCPTNTHRCAVPSPGGWSRPSAIVEGVPSPDCPSTYPVLLVDGRDDVAGAPATCECACGTPEIACGNLLLFYRTNCQQPIGPDDNSGPFDTCLDATPKQNAVTAAFDEKASNCPPIPKTTREPPTAQTAYRACGTNQIDGMCADGLVCIPEIVAPFRLCVTQDGDHPCPPGYLDRAVHYKGIIDTRACTDCACTVLTHGRCESVMQGYSDAACTTAQNPPLTSGDSWSNTGCVGSTSYYSYTKPIIAEQGTCTPGTVDPIGTTELSEPVTFCCASP